MPLPRNRKNRDVVLVTLLMRNQARMIIFSFYRFVVRGMLVLLVSEILTIPDEINRLLRHDTSGLMLFETEHRTRL